MVKKMVGSTPVVIGTKLASLASDNIRLNSFHIDDVLNNSCFLSLLQPVSYNGSLEENYLEISLDVTKGPAFGNSVRLSIRDSAKLSTLFCTLSYLVCFQLVFDRLLILS